MNHELRRDLVINGPALVEVTLDVLERALEETEKLRHLSSLLDHVLGETRAYRRESLAHAATAIHAAAAAAQNAALQLTQQAAFLDAIATVRRTSSDG